MGLSTIQWCDWTFNPWIGCRKVADECKNCYAETLDRNRYSKTLAPGTKANPVSHWGGGPRHKTKTWKNPLIWNRYPWVCSICGAAYAKETMRDGLQCINNLSEPGSGAFRCQGNVHRPRVFCASLADWLDDENVPIEWFADLLKLIHDTPNLDWLLLTKRPQNWSTRCEQVRQWAALNAGRGGDEERNGWQWEPYDWLLAWMVGVAPANVWIGVSAGADQAAALAIPARVHFLSCEPMLRPLDTTHAAQFDWIIFGGESGSKARPVDTRWIREGIALCRVNGIAPFVKQLGAHCIGYNGTHALNLKDSHGGDMDEWPEDLRVREFPAPL